MRLLAPLVALALLAGCLGPSGGEPPARPGDDAPATTTPAPPAGAPARAALRLEPFVEGLESPVFVAEAPDGSGRLLALEQAGRVRLVANGSLREAPVADLTDRVGAGGERGLLGLAFHPRFAENGAVFLSYTDREGDSVLARYAMRGDVLDVASEEVLLRVDQPYPNHNGGMVAFGPDGLLYYGLGDGGAAGDPHNNGQDPDALLGSLLRLDVDAATPEPEIFAKGLRNPWRFSFDRATGDLWIGDVGQGAWEEIDLDEAPLTPGRNYGWAVFEGAHRFRPGETFSEHVPPVAEYAREDGNCAVTGGYAYRGESLAGWNGTYFFADYCSGRVWSLRHEDGERRVVEELRTDARITSFGEDARGELYVVDHGGRILRLAAS